MFGLIDAANKLRELLPCKFDQETSFQDGMKAILDEYLQTIKSFDDNDFERLISMCKLNVRNLSKTRFYNFAKLISDAVTGIIETYLDGNPHDAYSQLDNLFSHNKVKKKEPAHGYKYINTYIDDMYVNLFSHDTSYWNTLYRIRIGTDIKEDDMYHVPFDLREKVGTYRFSIPGWPAFYVGTTVDVSWAEVGRELKDEENVYVAKFSTQEKWMLFNLQIPPEFGFIDSMAKACYLYYFLSTFPFFAASLVKVKKTDGAFKPEYIIPQMILQCVKSNSLYKFKGILYSSTKFPTWTEKINSNIVIPPKKASEGRYSEYITDNFHIVDFKNLGNDIIVQKLRDFQNPEV